MAHSSSPAYALVVAANTTTYPKTNDIRGSTTAADSPFKTTELILEAMICLVVSSGAANIVVSNHAADAENSFTFTTLAATAPGTTIRFGENGMRLGKGIKVVAAATTGTWMYVFRPI